MMRLWGSIFIWALLLQFGVFGSVVCPETLYLASGTEIVGEKNVNWGLNIGTGFRSFTHEFYYGKEFPNIPKISINLVSVDIPSGTPIVDILIIDVFLDRAVVNIRTWSNSIVKHIQFGWLASVEDCMDVAASGVYTTNWIDSKWKAFQSFNSLSVPFTHGAKSVVDDRRIGGVAGLSFSTARTMFSTVLANVTSNAHTHNVFGYLNGTRLSSHFIEEVGNSFIDVLSIRISPETMPNFNSLITCDLGSPNCRRASITVPFSQKFYQIPRVMYVLRGFDFGVSQPRFKILDQTITLSHVTIDIATYNGASIKSWDMDLFVYHIRANHFTFFDQVLLILVIVSVVTMLIFECTRTRTYALRNPKTATNVHPIEAWPKSYPSFPAEQEPTAWRIAKKSTVRLVGRLNRVAEENQTMEEQMHAWRELLKGYSTFRQQANFSKRDRFEQLTYRVFGIVLLVGLFFLFRDVLLKYQVFHSLNDWLIAFVTLGLEYLLLFASIVFVDWPRSSSLPRSHDDVAILIASHNSASTDSIQPDSFMGVKYNATTPQDLLDIEKQKRDGFLFTLKNLSQMVPDGQVYVCHNANSFQPPEKKTLECVRTIEKWGRNINYVYVPAGNKTLSLYWTAKQLPDHIKYVLICDDDIIMPNAISFQTELLEDENVAGAAFTIRTAPKYPKQGLWHRRSLLTWFQDVEYMLAGFAKLFQSRVGGTAMCPHGALSIWKKEVITEVLLRHTTMFNGEDLSMGLILREMAAETGKKQLILRTFANQPVYTNVPQELFRFKEDFFGAKAYGDKSLCTQRVKSWDVTAHRSIFVFLKHILLFWNSHTLLLKLYYMYEVLTVIQDLLRFFLVFYYIYLDDAMTLSVLLIRVLEIQIILLILFNFLKLKHRPELKAPGFVLILFPVYRVILLVFRFLAFLYNLWRYLPTQRVLDRVIDNPNMLPPWHPIVNTITKDPVNWSRVWISEALPEVHELSEYIDDCDSRLQMQSLRRDSWAMEPSPLIVTPCDLNEMERSFNGVITVLNE
ncbi:hypothetical protein PCE1_000468 [Barthelona sp. PCE]